MYYTANIETVEAIKRAKGKVLGTVFITDREYIINTEGKEGLKKAEERLRDMGLSLSYEEIQGSKFYPIGHRILSLIAISQALTLSPKEIRDMGFNAPRISSVIKLFARFFLSAEEVFKRASKIWEKHYTTGRLEQVEIDSKKRHAIIRLHNVNLHPVFCDYLTGYFAALVRMSEGKDATVEETKCYFKGDSFHNFIIKW